MQSWKAFVDTSPAANVVVVAHSAGGAWLCECLKQTPPDQLGRIKAIAFTDTFHDADALDATRRQLVRDHARHWRTGSAALDTPVGDERGSGCTCLSAGTTDHASTNFTAQSSIFAFFGESLR
eukprot:COSAG04_NODE_468_length_13857_cov_28.468382_7_plen_123_part_00